MRRKIVAGNWKMNLGWDEANRLLLDLNRYVTTHKPNCEVIVCPPAPYLHKATEIFRDHISVGAQNISENENGAFTGEISGDILNSLDVKYAIVGHSERRSIYHETNEQVGAKVDKAIEKGIIAIICCGETLEEREAEKQQEIVRNQIETALNNVSAEDMEKQVIAYEPVWAIGTGVTASPTQAQEMHEFIRRDVLEPKYGAIVADKVRILYGGSVKLGNAEELFAQPDIDGGLVGGASLKEQDFTPIIARANN